MKIKELKSKLKALTAQIRQDKFKYKESQRGNLKWDEYYAWRKAEGILSDQYRHNHIAYCLLRGRKYEQIESKVRDGNEPRWSYVETVMKEYREVEQLSDGDMVV